MGKHFWNFHENIGMGGIPFAFMEGSKSIIITLLGWWIGIVPMSR